METELSHYEKILAELAYAQKTRKARPVIELMASYSISPSTAYRLKSVVETLASVYSVSVRKGATRG
jgi:hypothetical protein